ncbi:MAG: ABC transporter permease, partial [Anaerolineae bacterium]
LTRRLAGSSTTMYQKLFSALAGIGIALGMGAIILVVEGRQPLEVYGALAALSLSDVDKLATTLKNAVPLILTGLSASLAFASGPVNLGQPGQFLMGALAVTLVGIAVDLPAPLMVPLLIAAAMAGGALWAGVAALLRHAFNMSEFIVTLMLNSVAELFTAWLITIGGPLAEAGALSPRSPAIASGGRLGDIGAFNISIFVMALAALAIWYVFHRTRAGYEWRIAGQNTLFARLGGCPVDRNFFIVMLVSGALAGLAGGLLVMSGPYRFIRGIGANYAWDGVMIAVVANSALAATVLYGLFFAALQTGALGMELLTAVPSEFIQVLQAVIVLVSVASRGYLSALLDRLALRRRHRQLQALAHSSLDTR